MSSCLIIGGGIIGMLTARELCAAGLDVTLLEKGSTGRESSWAGGGIISPLYPWRYAPSVTLLARWGQRHYRQLAEELAADTGVDPEWTPSGLLILDPEEQRESSTWAQQFSQPLQAINQHELRQLVPELHNPSSSALWLPDVAQVRNPRLAKALRLDIDRREVKVIEQTEVSQLIVEKGQAKGVKSSQGDFYADHTIVCAGAWSGQLLADLNAAPTIEPVMGQMLLYRAKPCLISSMVLSGNRYVIPRRDGRILVGSTLERTGFIKETTEAALHELQAAATRLFPKLTDYPIEHHWAGLRPGSPNGIPYIGEHPEIEGLYLNAGHFRNGVVLAPASCRLLADLLLQREPILPPTPYALTADRA
ncbi:glycine oxidase ThiO [Pseudomonadota bacterium]